MHIGLKKNFMGYFFNLFTFGELSRNNTKLWGVKDNILQALVVSAEKAKDGGQCRAHPSVVLFLRPNPLTEVARWQWPLLPPTSSSPKIQSFLLSQVSVSSSCRFLFFLFFIFVFGLLVDGCNLWPCFCWMQLWDFLGLFVDSQELKTLTCSHV